MRAVASGVPLCISYAGLLQREDENAGKARELLGGQAFYPSCGVRAMPGGRYVHVEILHWLTRQSGYTRVGSSRLLSGKIVD